MKRRTFASGFLSVADVPEDDEDEEDEDEDEDDEGGKVCSAGVSLEIFLSVVVLGFPDSLVVGSVWKSLIFPWVKLDSDFSFSLGAGAEGMSSPEMSSYGL